MKKTETYNKQVDSQPQYFTRPINLFYKRNFPLLYCVQNTSCTSTLKLNKMNYALVFLPLHTNQNQIQIKIKR